MRNCKGIVLKESIDKPYSLEHMQKQCIRWVDEWAGVGWCYEHGSSIAIDKAEAFKWYKLSADQGSAVAQYNLAQCYDHGRGVAVDRAEAFKYLRLSADQSNTDALNAVTKILV